MTYAPRSLLDVRAYLMPKTGLSASALGIVGDTAHADRGVSYHLGANQLTATAYSRQTARDRAGLTDAASALDIGNFRRLRTLSVWLVGRARVNAPGTRDLREIIYSPDGLKVLRWDRERGYASAPRGGEADGSHLWHTHISWYRDARERNQVPLFVPFFEPITWGKDVPLTIRAAYTAGRVATKLRSLGVKNFGTAINLSDLEAGLRARGIDFGTSVQLIDVQALMKAGTT